MATRPDRCTSPGLSHEFRVTVASPDQLQSLASLQRTLLSENPAGRAPSDFELLQFIVLEGPGLVTGAGTGFAEEAIRLGFFRDPDSGVVVEAFTLPAPPGAELGVGQLAAAGLDGSALLRDPLPAPDLDLRELRDRFRSETARDYLSRRPDAVTFHVLIATEALVTDLRRSLGDAPAAWVSASVSAACLDAMLSVSPVPGNAVVLSRLVSLDVPVPIGFLFLDDVGLKAAFLVIKLFIYAFLFGLSFSNPVSLALTLCALGLAIINVLKEMIEIARLTNGSPTVQQQLKKLQAQQKKQETELEALKERAEALERQLAEGQPVTPEQEQELLRDVGDALEKLDGSIEKAIGVTDPDTRERLREARQMLDGRLEGLKGTEYEKLLPKRLRD